jgi:hypothetical protein
MNTLFGSHLYELNNENSDEDWKGIYLPTVNELLLNKYPRSIKYSSGDANSKNGFGDIDLENISLPRLVELGCKSDTMAIDILHATKNIERGTYAEIWDSLVENRTKFYSKDMSSLIGYLKHQASKYGVKGSRMSALKVIIEVLPQLIEDYPNAVIGDVVEWLPYDDNCKYISVVNTKTKPSTTNHYYEVLGKKFQNTLKLTSLQDSIEKWYDNYGHRAREAEKNNGVDWKAVSHALRAGYQVIDIYQQGDFEYPLSQTQYLRDVKEGKLDFSSNVKEELEWVTDLAMELSAKSDLPEVVDVEWWDNWLLDVYGNHYHF